MSLLPLLISVPHAGLLIPDELKSFNQLDLDEIAKDGDEGASEVYSVLKDKVNTYITTDIARAFVDLNRAEDDIRKDGVVKTHTCWDIPIYQEPPSDEVFHQMILKYHRTYHQQLTDYSHRNDMVLAVDCHTMADIAPPVAPDKGQKRPMICLGDNNGKSCPKAWSESLFEILSAEFNNDVALNIPFSGGYITQHHGKEMPWIQLELSRSSEISNADKGLRILNALQQWHTRIG